VGPSPAAKGITSVAAHLRELASDPVVF